MSDNMYIPQSTDLFVRSLPFWEHLESEQKHLISIGSTTVDYKKGEKLVDGSDRCVGLLLIKRGELRTYTISEDGRSITLFRLRNGDICIMAAWCLLPPLQFPIYIEADTDVSGILIHAGALGKLIEKNIYAKEFCYETEARRLSDMLWVMQQMIFLSTDQRLARFLLEESKATGSDELHLTHERIATYMGSAREVVSRLMKYFSKEGMVRGSRGRIVLLDKKRLSQIAAQ